MKKISYSLLLIIGVLISSATKAAHIENRQSVSGSYISIVDMPLPNKLLDKELTSGLPNNVSLIIKIYRKDKLLAQTRVNSKVIYDLWDEVFIVETLAPPSISVTRFTNKTRLLTSLKEINLSQVLHNKGISVPASELSISLQVIYNPVDKERIKKVQQWIRDNNGYGQLQNERLKKDNLPPNHSGNGLRFKKLFDKIIDDYIPEEGFSAQWKSKSIRLEIPVEKESSKPGQQ